MSENTRPNVVGKGPSLSREMIDLFNEIQQNASILSADLKNRISTQLSQKGADLEKVIKMAYLKTVKAGETAWDLKEKTIELKNKVASGDEGSIVGIMDDLEAGVDQFLHKIKTFVVRMT
jgi:hypothetical protein